MEVYNISQILLVISAACFVSASSLGKSDWLQKAIDETKTQARLRRSHKGTDNVMKSKLRNCCQNGGLCIMGAFCDCPKNYYGRYCEHKLRRRKCASLAHGKWMKAGCNLCRCYDGQIICTPDQFTGCEYSPMQSGVDPDATYAGSEFHNSDYDTSQNFYDGYEGDFNSSDRITSGPMALFVLTLLSSLVKT